MDGRLQRVTHNVHYLGPVKCPPGSKAIHKDYGWCDVIAADGMARTIVYEVHEPDATLNLDDLPEGVMSEEVLFSENIQHAEAEVDVRDLHEVNPEKDVRPRETASKVLFHGK